MTPVANRFLKYVRVSTQSSETSETSPTTASQFALADLLADELRAIGVSDVKRDEFCYVYGTIPATKGCENAPGLGFIAHVDTATDFSGDNVNPVILDNFDGKDVRLGSSNYVLSSRDFPELPSLRGKTLIVTDGTTLLGADDKAGVAEIVTLADELIHSGKPHGKICIAFTPDEEVGKGPDHFDVAGFGADFAYTMDGGAAGEIEYENFNAAAAQVTFHGVNVHPGSAKNIMVNAMLLAMEFNAMLPADEIPAKTEGYEGFYHLLGAEGDTESAVLRYIIRDHDADTFAARCQTMRDVTAAVNEKYGSGKAELLLRDQYRNMKEMIAPCMHLIDNAVAAAQAVGLTPKICPIRGGTDGARLSFMGLPCPNLGTGGYGFHGPYEHIAVEDMEKTVEMMHALVSLYNK